MVGNGDWRTLGMAAQLQLCGLEDVSCQHVELWYSLPFLTLAQLKEPFCMPFGNRRLLHCMPARGGDDAHEVPAWEACGKVVKKEQRNFYEFVVSMSGVWSLGPLRPASIAHRKRQGISAVSAFAFLDLSLYLADSQTTNILLLVICLVIYGVRTSELATQQYRQLAARIGIPSGAWQV
jgi:hypothetical protein